MFKPIKTTKITDNLYTINSIITNFYIYDTGKNLIIFDTGISTLLAKKGFKKLNLDYNKVSHVFLTHSDFDHVGGLKLFKKAKVCLSKKEEPLITRKKARRVILYNKKIKNYNLMNNLEEIKIDDTVVKLMTTPGHTVGSSIYILNNSILILGDTISLSRNGDINNFSFIQNMNHKENKETVKKLKDEKIFDNVNIILTGHHGILKK